MFPINGNSNLAPGTIELYERQYRTKLSISKLAIKHIHSITSSDIQKYLNSLALAVLDGKPIKVTQGSLKALGNFLKHLFRYMALEGYCPNLMLAVNIPQIAKSGSTDLKNIQVFSEEEIYKILSTPNPLQNLFILASATGLREGELLSLHSSDFSGNSVKVSRQLNNHNHILPDGTRISQTVLKIPKTSKSLRVVPIPSSLSHIVSELKNMDGFLFLTNSGEFIDKRNFLRAWKRHLKKAGVDYKKFHALRATYCTMLCKYNTPIETAAALMGHSNIETTAKYYRAIGKSELENAVENINHLFI